MSENLQLQLAINGQPHTMRVDPRVTLLDALREHLTLTGTKKGCDQGQCGACTVLINGKRLLSCLTLAAQANGQSVTTIEGLAPAAGTLHPVQARFLEHDAFQCGYCTPGFVNSATVLVEKLQKHPVPADEVEKAIEEQLEPHICRCTGYVRYYNAVRDVILKTPGLTTGKRSKEVVNNG